VQSFPLLAPVTPSAAPVVPITVARAAEIGDNQHTARSAPVQTLPLLAPVTPPVAPVVPITIDRAAKIETLAHGERADLVEARDVPGHLLPLLGDVIVSEAHGEQADRAQTRDANLHLLVPRLTCPRHLVQRAGGASQLLSS